MRFTKELRRNDAMTACRRYGVAEPALTVLARILMDSAPGKFPKAKMIVLDLDATFMTFEEIESDGVVK